MGEQVAARSHGGVAQLGEHLPCKQGVKSSNLSVSIGVSMRQQAGDRKCRVCQTRGLSSRSFAAYTFKLKSA